MTTAEFLPLFAGLVLLLLLAALIISSVVGISGAVATLPVLYLTGFGLVPLQWTPAHGTAFYRSALGHVFFGGIILGITVFTNIYVGLYHSGSFSYPVVGDVTPHVATFATSGSAFVVLLVVSYAGTDIPWKRWSRESAYLFAIALAAPYLTVTFLVLIAALIQFPDSVQV